MDKNTMSTMKPSLNEFTSDIRKIQDREVLKFIHI